MVLQFHDEMDAQADLIRFIRAIPAFAPLSEDRIADFIGEGRQLCMAAGDMIVSQGDASDCAFILLDGEADVFVETSFGPVMLAPLSAGYFFGEIGALAGIPRTATIRARSAVRVLRIERDAILALGRSHSDLLASVIRQLGQRTATVNRAIGFYTQALAALERHDFDPSILDELLNPVPELLDFAQTFRRMAEQIILRRAQHQEMASAAAIQRAMLPSPQALKSFGSRVDIHATIRPAREVGGDLYNYFGLDADRVAIVIGDVSGKGVPASLFMAIIQTVMRLAIREIDDLETAVGRANEFLSVDNRESMFATLFCGVIDLRLGTLTYCNCGHNPPLLLHASGAMESLSPCGPALALLPSVVYRPRTLGLAQGDRIILYTDGITEASNAAFEQFGEDRLQRVFRDPRRLSAEELVRSILHHVDDFVADAPQFDDIACLALCYRGASGDAVA
jgi:sigma-B regulation protein RsbU (phosphoserine phosphatase)